MCKRSTCANGTIDGFFIPVSPLGETCDGLFELHGKVYLIVIDYYSRQSNGEAERALRHEGAAEEERRSTHRSHGIQIDAALEWAISSRIAHGPKIAHSTIALKPRGSHGESLERKEGLRRSDKLQNFN